jgi:protein-L-isoaspartate(D-aspartate) O-methyltransferase
MNTDKARFNMIEQQIRPWNVLDADILALLGRVKREEFVPENLRNLAFADMDLPLSDGQFMLSPKLEARLLHDLQIQTHETVLEIGAGSGYMAALLAQRAHSVLSLEIKPALVDFARSNLDKAGVGNAQIKWGCGAKDASKLGQFDVIVLSGSVASVPPALLALLKPGGRLAAVVGDVPIMQAHFVTRAADGSLSTRNPWDICAPRLLNFPETSAFRF